MSDLIKLGKKAKEASYVLSTASMKAKDDALKKIAQGLKSDTEDILNENKKDVKRARDKNVPESLVDRLILTKERIVKIADSLVDITELNDPVGEVVKMWERPNGIRIGKQRVPLGVIGIIYESRPNVTADAAGLCIKAGNTVVLRGGSDAINSNLAIVNSIRKSLSKSKLPKDCVQIVEDTSREKVKQLMQLNEYIDVLIPRGGAGLINTVVQNSTVPVIETGTGNCHVYVDTGADLDMALDIIVNAKTSRPGVCNAAETLLVAKSEAKDFLPKVKKALTEKNVELRCCKESYDIMKDDTGDNINPAADEDWGTEYLDNVLAVKTVKDSNEAIKHINKYGTKHSEAIVTNNYKEANKFLKMVDAAAVYVNASTRFTDGGEFGFGAEIGISTQKLHARGPMGLKELTTVKYIVYGDGQIRKQIR